MDAAARALDRADDANRAVSELKGELKSQLEDLRRSWANDLRQNHDYYTAELDKHDSILRGNGNGIVGHSVRIDRLETTVKTLRWVAGSAFLMMLALLGRVLYAMI